MQEQGQPTTETPTATPPPLPQEINRLAAAKPPKRKKTVVECPTCGKRPTNRHALGVHHQRVHGTPLLATKAQLKCGLCPNFEGKNEAAISRHMHDTHHKPGWSLFAPQPATNRNGANGSNGAHSNGAHAAPVKWKNTRTPCPECGAKGFKRATTFGAHRRSEHGVLGASPSVLHKRRKGRGGSKPTKGRVQCPDCPRDFGTPLALAVHRRFAHGVAGANAHKTPKRGRPKGKRDKAQRGHVEAFAQPAHEVAVRRCNFCPQCGTDMGLIEKAMSLQA